MWPRSLLTSLVLVTLLALSAPGCSDPADCPTCAEDVVCPACSQAGETFDFGVTGTPTPCEASEVKSSIDEVQARELGFGPELDLLNREFSDTLEWRREEAARGSARGYEPFTRIEGQIRLAGIELLMPSLALCEPRLRVAVDVSLHTVDGAITSAAGQLTGLLTRGDRPSIGAWLDLTTVRGRLRVRPGEPAARTAGFLNVGLTLWPDVTRGRLLIELNSWDAIDDPRSPGFPDHLITGRFPADDCGEGARPWPQEAPSADLAGLSPNQVHERVVALIQSPAPAHWSNGDQTEVVVEVDMPYEACVGQGGLGYHAQIKIRSLDGRANLVGVDSVGANLADDGSITHASLALSSDTPIPPKKLAAVADIPGVTFSEDAHRVDWVVLFTPIGPPFTGGSPGQLLITTSDKDGYVLGDLVALSWTNDPAKP